MILQAAQLAFAYPGRRDPTFADINLDISDGEILCVLGPNGIGKSTLLRCLAGLASPTAGTVHAGGAPIASLPRAEVAKLLALVPQTHETVFAFAVQTVVEMGRAPHLGWFEAPGRETSDAALDALETLGIVHLAESAYTEISGGERQLVQIARVLVQAPKLMILDEPTSHLDFANQAGFLALARKLAASGLAIIFSTHAPDQAFQLADNTLILSPHTAPVLGRTAEVLTTENLSKTYEVPIIRIALGAHVTFVAEVI